MQLTITREEYQSLKAEWLYLCALSEEAGRLWFDLDFREGIALLDGNQKHIFQCRRLKMMAMRRIGRRAIKRDLVYEESQMEAFDMVTIAGWKPPRFATAKVL